LYFVVATMFIVN